ncbi:MAG: hypothetical protein HY706_00630 [Candidatus Hydrogenedentes bacterium]|nr:hypothetical protein [Candidatus Hydrogenedentota bacterium]
MVRLSKIGFEGFHFLKDILRVTKEQQRWILSIATNGIQTRPQFDRTVSVRRLAWRCVISVIAGVRYPTGLIFFLGACAASAWPETRPQYIFFHQAPGTVWNQGHPESFTPDAFNEIRDTIAAEPNSSLRIGVAFTFSILETPTELLADSLRRLLAASEASGVPVLVGLDGQNWWETRSDLWNWWDPSLPGYNPNNVNNVEWTGWAPSSAVKIGWRNWGSQIRVRPAPNLASPQFMAEHLDRYKVLVGIVADWYRRLPADRKYLFGGLKIGWEASIGVNAFYYPDGNRYLERWPEDPSHDPITGFDPPKGLSGGLVQLGYAAVKTAGIKSTGEITRSDIATVVQRYLEQLCRAAYDLGIPRDMIFTHQGGTFAPWDQHLPFTAAFNEWSIPGWSFYALDPARAGDLGFQLDKAGRRVWAAAEWWWGAPDAAAWKDHFERTLRFRDCRFICVYNWNSGFSFANEDSGHEAVREVAAGWKSGK